MPLPNLSKKPVKAVSVATTGSRTAQREEKKSYGSKQNTKRRTAADRSRVIMPTQSSQRKVTTKPAPKQKEVREERKNNKAQEKDEQLQEKLQKDEKALPPPIRVKTTPEKHKKYQDKVFG